VEARTRIDLPSSVTRPFDVFVNGVPQTEGTDYEVVGSALLFERELVREGNLGFWRWARMFFGIAGSYRRNDTIDVVYAVAGRRVVASLPAPHLATEEAKLDT
jgi:hypothetical protein